jgi:23S rRNA (uracil1939-C5)-methyltransferase/tRNA (uracil-5-)-methyltransferase
LFKRINAQVALENDGGGRSRSKKRRAKRAIKRAEKSDVFPHGEGPFEYHALVELEIEGLSNLGEGIGRVELPAADVNNNDSKGASSLARGEESGGQVVESNDSTGRRRRGDNEEERTKKKTTKFVVMVPGVIPGEKVLVKVWQNRRTHSVADLVKVLEPSPKRVTPLCPLFGECGGCQYQFMDISDQRAMKTGHVVDVMTRLGGIDFDNFGGSTASVNDVVGTEQVYG